MLDSLAYLRLGGGGGCLAATRWLRWLFETVKSCRYSQDVRQRCQILRTIFTPLNRASCFSFIILTLRVAASFVAIWVQRQCVASCSLIREMTEEAALRQPSFTQNITFVETELKSFGTHGRPHQMAAGRQRTPKTEVRDLRLR